MLRKDLANSIEVCRDKKIFLRVDFNVPVKGGKIIDTYRVDSTIETIKILKNVNAAVGLFSHLEIKGEETPSLKIVHDYIVSAYPELGVSFASINDIDNSLSGIVLFDNIRMLKAEKENDLVEAEKIGKSFDVYINDAFAVSHRSHMSVSSIKNFFDEDKKFFGLQMQKEIDALSEFIKPTHPLCVIISGLKFATKLPLIKRYEDDAEVIMVGGALCNNILMDKGYSIGKSVFDTEFLKCFSEEKSLFDKIYVPNTFKVLDTVTNEVVVKKIDNISADETIQDFSEEGVLGFVSLLKEKEVKSIIWNGPLGNYEDVRFRDGTLLLLDELLKLVDVKMIIGGGDTVAAIADKHINNKNIFVSTGGGAMLEFLEKKGDLPGVR